jgi:hypothetical protein
VIVTIKVTLLRAKMILMLDFLNFILEQISKDGTKHSHSFHDRLILYWRNSSSSVFQPLSPPRLRIVDRSAAISLARRKPSVGYARRISSSLNAVSLIYFDKKHTLMYSPKKFPSCSSGFQLLQGCVSNS